ncbi:MAG: hypothetical protein JXK07_00995 [Spirochaetes bacterium]|nr:hypothetical protein [Spirochaetota bacterium]
MNKNYSKLLYISSILLLSIAFVLMFLLKPGERNLYPEDTIRYVISNYSDSLDGSGQSLSSVDTTTTSKQIVFKHTLKKNRFCELMQRLSNINYSKKDTVKKIVSSGITMLLLDGLIDTSDFLLLKKIYSLDSSFVISCCKENKFSFIQRNMFAGTCFDFYRKKSDPLCKNDSIYKIDISDYDSIRIEFSNTSEDHGKKFLKIQLKLWIPGYTIPQEPNSHYILQSEIVVPDKAPNFTITKSINRDFREPDYKIGKMPQMNTPEMNLIFGFNLQSGSPAECDSTRIFIITGIKLIKKANFIISSLSLGRNRYTLRRYETVLICIIAGLILLSTPTIVRAWQKFDKKLKELKVYVTLKKEVKSEPKNIPTGITDMSVTTIDELLKRRKTNQDTWENCRAFMASYEQIYRNKKSQISNDTMCNIIGINNSGSFTNVFKTYVPCSPTDYQGICYLKNIVVNSQGSSQLDIVQNVKDKFPDKWKDLQKNFSDLKSINALFYSVENITIDEFVLLANMIKSFEKKDKGLQENDFKQIEDDEHQDIFKRYKHQSVTLTEYRCVVEAKLIIEKKQEETIENIFNSIQSNPSTKNEIIDSPRRLNDVFKMVEVVDINDYCYAMKAKSIYDKATKIDASEMAEQLKYEDYKKLRKIFMIVTGGDLR